MMPRHGMDTMGHAMDAAGNRILCIRSEVHDNTTLYIAYFQLLLVSFSPACGHFLLLLFLAQDLGICWWFLVEDCCEFNVNGATSGGPRKFCLWGR